jgi:flagellin-like protein
MLKMKGISPVIAVVLLVAVAISMGMLVTSWITHLYYDISGGEGACAIKTNYVIDSAQWNQTSKSARYNSTLLIKITNKGELKLHGFGAEILNGTRIVNFDSGEVDQGGISSTNKLDRERSTYLLVNLTNSSFNYPAFGISLLTSDEVSVKVTNLACAAVSAETTSVS